MEPYKYLHNLLANPIILGLFLIGVVLVLYGLFISLLKLNKNKSKKNNIREIPLSFWGENKAAPH